MILLHGGRSSGNLAHEATPSDPRRGAGGLFLLVYRLLMGTSNVAALSPKCDCIVGRSGAYGVMVNEMIAVGMSANAIEKTLREKGHAIKRETVTQHRRRCLHGTTPQHNPVGIAKVANNRAGTSNGGPPKEVRDLAKMVQQKAIEGLENGQLKVTIKDGLAATALLDKRDARMEDQKFIIGLARLLSGAGHVGPSEVVIDVTPSNPLLAPTSLRGDE